MSEKLRVPILLMHLNKQVRTVCEPVIMPMRVCRTVSDTALDAQKGGHQRCGQEVIVRVWQKGQSGLCHRPYGLELGL